MSLKIGDQVRVSKDEPEGFGGRTGVIVRENQFGKGHDSGGLWYLHLEATKRAKARAACIWGKYLEVQGEEG